MHADVKRSHPGEEAVKVPRVRGMEQQGVAAEPGQLALLEHMESSEGLRGSAWLLFLRRWYEEPLSSTSCRVCLLHYGSLGTSASGWGILSLVWSKGGALQKVRGPAGSPQLQVAPQVLSST